MTNDQLEMIQVLHDLKIADMSKIYTAIGVIFITQIGTILTAAWGVIKIYSKIVVWKTTVEISIEENSKDISEAHIKIRDLQHRFMDGKL